MARVLTRMARVLTRMARVLTRMTRWLAYYTHSLLSIARLQNKNELRQCKR